MTKDSNGIICLCPLDGIIDVISKKWSLLIINEIGNHKRIRYNNLMKELQGITPKRHSKRTSKTWFSNERTI